MAFLTVAQIAELCGTNFEGDGERLITGANTLEDAGEHEIAFAVNRNAADLARASLAGCLLVRPDFAEAGEWALLRVDQPRTSFAQVLSVLYARPKQDAFCHPSAVIEPNTSFGPNVSIGAFTVIGTNSKVGAGCMIGSGCFLGENVSIGDDSILYPNVTIYSNVQIGSRATVHSGCVIGADGFGFAKVGDGYQKFPQVGTVVIGDDVELGANTCVDRAALGRTVIGDGCKLDNLVHIAHNVRIGRHVVIAAQTGFSGGVTVGDGAVIGGQVGIGDKAKIDSKAVVGSGSGILTGAHVQAGEPVWGTPARPLRQHLKGLAHVSRLGEYRDDLRKLKRQIAEMSEQDPQETKT